MKIKLRGTPDAKFVGHTYKLRGKEVRDEIIEID